MNYPKISVIIPTFNNAVFLHQALASVHLQAYENIEIIIIDDGSTDHTASLRLGINCKMYSIPHSGAAAARNHGVRHATGELLAFLDADDLWPYKKLHTQLEHINNQSLDATFTSMKQFIDETVAHLKIKEPGKVMQGICASTMLIRRDKFLKIGAFNDKYKLGEFIEWFMRAKNHGLKFTVIEDLVTLRRIHGNNTSSRCKVHKKDYLTMLYEGLKYRAADVITD